jgi:hypothetical protein
MALKRTGDISCTVLRMLQEAVALGVLSLPAVKEAFQRTAHAQDAVPREHLPWHCSALLPGVQHTV